MASLRTLIERDHPSDPMMQDIRLVRDLHALADKKLSFAELMGEYGTGSEAKV